MTPLALTDSQLDIIREQQRKLRIGWHRVYRAMIEDRLLAFDEIDDDAVRDCAIDVMEKIKLPTRT